MGKNKAVFGVPPLYKYPTKEKLGYGNDILINVILGYWKYRYCMWDTWRRFLGNPVLLHSPK